MFGYMKEFHEYYLKLLQLAEYEMETDEKRIAYGYQPSSHEDLTLLREKYLLERVAGTGDELSQIKNLTQWVNERLPHGNVRPPEQVNALHVLGLSDSEPIQMNCYVIATVLNEVFLSLGFHSRRVHCRSYDAYDLDSHVVTLVYSNTLSKWVCMDGSWNCYLTDDSRIPLSLEEFRERLSSNQPVWVNGESTETDWSIFYKGYMAKNMFWFYSPVDSEYNYEARMEKDYCALLPEHFTPIELMREIPVHQSVQISRNPQNFWSRPSTIMDKPRDKKVMA
ncbi:hypothetical protein M4D81_10155 [Paenibacillus sp. p3-SID867]|uniref:hypothetical protein n=1 Tax=Paenibacillus sp. p3-SID867 TaxID=2916363 RepID=UPI0021A7221F|nr:hypothetical protein [Paenibacillus sp. p3-SID867]MCT1399382.1 hypothetical protein [Paenibacillus sp. p3-SID867]